MRLTEYWSAELYGARPARWQGVRWLAAAPAHQVGDILLSASYRKEEADVDGGFAGLFGRIAQTYFQRYGDRSEELA